MANTGFLSSSELDFDTIKENFKSYLEGQSAFEDYNFEGSNMSVLLDILSYNTMMNNYYLNMAGSELFLDTSLLKETVVSHAKELNYVPRSVSSASIVGTITIVPDDSPASITIPKNYAITTTIDNVTYNFITDEAVVIKNNGGSYVSGDITFYEGEIVTELFTVSTSNTNSYSYPINSENIDSNSIEVNVQTSNTDTSNTNYTKASSLYGLDNTSTVYFVEGYKDNLYQIVFGNDVIGKALVNGNLVKVTYRDSLGDAANFATNFSKSSNISGYNDITIQVTGSSSGGASRESIADIKYNAPRHFQSQERAVTAEDFKTYVKEKFTQVQAVTAYGGEEASPKQYGKIIISVKPYGTTVNISDRLKNEIISYLKLKSLTTEPIMTDPNYFYVEIISEAQFNPLLTSSSSTNIKSTIESDLSSLNLSSFNDFGKDFRYSKILKVIDDSDDSITSNDTTIRLIKRLKPTVNTSDVMSFSYGNQLDPEMGGYTLPTGHKGIIESSVFTYTYNGIDYQSYIKDDGQGILYIYTISSDESVIKLNSNIGTVDYSTGDVVITANIKGYTDYISLYARLKYKDIIISKNNFLIIDSSDITITVIEERE